MKRCILSDDEYLMLRTLWTETFGLPYPETAPIDYCCCILGWDETRGRRALRSFCRHTYFSPLLHCSSSQALRDWLNSDDIICLLRSESDKRKDFACYSFFSHIEYLSAMSKLPKLLMPIKPKYLKKILSGEKQVEYRKTRYKAKVGGILFYATAPCKAIIAEAELDFVDKATPETIWQLTERFAGITRKEYDEYFKGSNIAVAYWLKGVYKLNPPKSLADYKIFYTPQSCVYVR